MAGFPSLPFSTPSSHFAYMIHSHSTTLYLIISFNVYLIIHPPAFVIIFFTLCVISVDMALARTCWSADYGCHIGA